MHIKNGRIIDPCSRTDQLGDIVVENGCIRAWGTNLDSFCPDDGNQIVIDATGCIVTPGLIDHHLHLYPFISNGIPGEAVCFSSGVTTAVDAGSSGCENCDEQAEFIKQSKLRIRQYLNVSPYGLSCLPETEDVSPEAVRADCIQEAFSRYGDRLLGLKLRTSKSVVGSCGYDALKRTMEIADKLSVPVMIHCTDPPGPMEELLSMLRTGDVLTHMYQNIGYTILDADGAVLPAARKARERGVLFETADARAHFSFEVSEQAFRQDFLPDIIGTDLTRFSMYQRPTAFNLPMQMSKYMNLGMSLYDVIRCVTEAPADSMGLSGKAGCLVTDGTADISIFRLEKRKTEFGDRPYYDGTGSFRAGEQILKPVMTICKGDIVYRDMEF